MVEMRQDRGDLATMPHADNLFLPVLQPTIQNVKKAAVALDTARYSEFWSIVKDTAAFETIPNWHNEIRKCESQAAFSAFHSISHSHH
jgi:hypothetical protein